MRHARWLLTLIAASAAGCAAKGENLFDGQPSARIYTMRQVQQRPVLRGCSRYTEPNQYYGVRAWVSVRFVIGSDGNVNPSSAVASGGSNDRPARADEDAVDAARSCVYSPALLKGVPVAVRTSRTFAIY